MAPRVPLVAGDGVVKIVWHMTGHGPLELGEYREGGRRVDLAWGPVAHGAGASNYDRPGQEWGAGYRFREPGCYRLVARRTGSRAMVWLRVAPAAARPG